LASARTASAADVAISWSDTKQVIDGFGASSAWFGVNLSNENSRALFDPKAGIGLSLLRVQIGLPNDLLSDGTEPADAVPVATAPELSTAQQAAQYGCRVWATAWTPPPLWKTTNSQNGSGTDFESNKLKPEHYQDYANYLADFVDLMTTNDVKLIGLSPANEPDYVATWDNAQWSGDEMAKFIADYLGPTFAARCPSVQLVVPDTATWTNLDSYLTPIAQNPKALAYTGVVATHPYPNGNEAPDWAYNKPQQLGKHFWQTEWSQENWSGDTPDPTMTSAIDMATHIHTNMVISQMNAWNWWAIYISADSLISQDKTGTRENPALIQADESLGKPYMFQRGYALGNWSKFVRPGFKRLGTMDPSSSLLVEAYRDDCHVALIAINTDATDVEQKFVLNGVSGVTALTPWVTSPRDKLTPKAVVPVSATDGSFTFTVPGKSVVTFVNWDASSYTPGDATAEPGASCPVAIPSTGGAAGAGGQNDGVAGTGLGVAGQIPVEQGGAAGVGASAVAGNGASKASDDDSGCGCRVVSSRESTKTLGLAALLMALVFWRRRRTSNCTHSNDAP
jgi:glucuronoarabinoxylan endo-1,4-beta-xylanase